MVAILFTSNCGQSVSQKIISTRLENYSLFPREQEKMIKEITDGALEIMNDVSRLKVIQLWAE